MTIRHASTALLACSVAWVLSTAAAEAQIHPQHAAQIRKAAKALSLGAGGFNAVVLGVITGVAGGVFRDVLVGEIPFVFRRETYLYATAAFIGVTAFVLLEAWLPKHPANRLIGTGLTLALRLASIQWKLSLPVFRSRE